MNQPPFKTNTWIEEEVEVPSFDPVVNEKEKRIEFVKTTKKATQKTFYADSPPTKIICNNHTYIQLDPGKYLYKCTKCDWHKIAYPVTYKWDPSDGSLHHRKTGQKI